MYFASTKTITGFNPFLNKLDIIAYSAFLIAINKPLDRKKIGFTTYISQKIKIQMINELKSSPIHKLGIFQDQLKVDLFSKKFMKAKYEYLLFRIFQVHLWFKIYQNSLEI